MSAAEIPWHPMYWLIAAGLGVYIAGVTWYARTEARESNRWRLAFGILVMAVGIGLLAWFPDWRDRGGELVNAPNNIEPERWRLLMAMLGALIGWRALWGVIEPVPGRVQIAIKQAILSVIVLDASICFLFRGIEGAAPIFLLIVPAMWLGRWIYST
jgi:4-hydroxybenzoate polyprenyltransferase